MTPLEELKGLGSRLDDLETALRSLTLRYGASAVRAAAMKVTKQRRGPKKRPDLRELKDVLARDVADWLDGRDPLKERTSYMIAQQFAATKQGKKGEQSPQATFQRVYKKLRENRRWIMLAQVEAVTRDGYPHAVHMRALEQAAAAHKMFLGSLEWATGRIALYAVRFQQQPPLRMSFNDIDEALRKPSEGALSDAILATLHNSSGLRHVTITEKMNRLQATEEGI